MKSIKFAIAAAAAMIAGTAFAQTTTAPAPTKPPVVTAPAAGTPPATTTTPSTTTTTTPAKKAKAPRTEKSLKCSAEATAQGLKGKPRKAFMKECKKRPDMPKKP